MAVVQISQVKHRRGLEENLPQLASAELGWSINTRRLYIGNGTLAEGAVEVGNTEIITAVSLNEYLTLSAINPITMTLTSGASTQIKQTETSYFDLEAAADPTAWINYQIFRSSDNASRSGTLKVSLTSLEDDYTETSDTQITFYISETSSGVYGIFAKNDGNDVTIKYKVEVLFG